MITLPALPAGGVWNWTCSASGGAACPASGTWARATHLRSLSSAGKQVTTQVSSLPSGGVATYTITSSVPVPGAWWAATASASVPADITDPVPDNNRTTSGYSILLPVMRK